MGGRVWRERTKDAPVEHPQDRVYATNLSECHRTRGKRFPPALLPLRADVTEGRVVELARARVVLREITPDDFNGVYAYASDPAVYRFVAFGPFDPKQTRRHLSEMSEAQHAEPRKLFCLAIVPRSLGSLVGVVSFEITRRHHKEGSIGVIVQQPRWNEGYATEACRALLGFVFGELGIHRVVATVTVGNDSSIRLFEKLGFTQEGQLRDHYIVCGRHRDSLLFSILRNEFQADAPDCSSS